LQKEKYKLVGAHVSFHLVKAMLFGESIQVTKDVISWVRCSLLTNALERVSLDTELIPQMNILWFYFEMNGNNAFETHLQSITNYCFKFITHSNSLDPKGLLVRVGSGIVELRLRILTQLAFKNERSGRLLCETFCSLQALCLGKMILPIGN